MELPGRGALSLRLRERPRALVLAAAWHPRRAARRLFRRGHPPRAAGAEVVRAALHHRMRPPRLAHGLLAETAETGARSAAGLRERSLLTAAWPMPSLSTSL